MDQKLKYKIQLQTKRRQLLINQIKMYKPKQFLKKMTKIINHKINQNNK